MFIFIYTLKIDIDATSHDRDVSFDVSRHIEKKRIRVDLKKKVNCHIHRTFGHPKS